MVSDHARAGGARVAVVMPCFNDGATIDEAVDSAVGPDQEECELIVIDDGSTDPKTISAFDRLERRGVRILHQPNLGAEVARMNGVLETSAPYIFPLDADDILVSGALAALADALDAHPEAAAAWGDGVTFGDTDVFQASYRRIDPWLLSYVNVLPGSGAFRRTKLLEVGGWTKKTEPGHEDWDIWMGFAERHYAGVYVPVSTLRYRVHGERRARRAMKNHDAVFAELQKRHPLLFEQRHENKKLSPAPWYLKIGIPLSTILTFVPLRARLAFRNLLIDPKGVLRLAIGLRLIRAKRRLRRGS